MRPLRLELTAFGPFAGTEVVDFEALATGGLFLVHGETGAGKTSVLDGLCFALYGCVPGARDRIRDVRSDHADPSRLTSVQLDFMVAGETHRIWRQPRQVASKLRGGGNTVHQPKVVLFRGANQELVSSRLDEVGLAMQDLLGMTADQFCQVVLLPQGEFARFLRADAKDRQELLERLFAAERYRAIETLLATDKAAAGGRVAELETRADRLLHMSASEAESDGPPEGADASWVASLTTRIRAEADQAAAAVRVAQAAEGAARRQYDVASLTAAAQARLRSALHRRDELIAAAPDRKARGAELLAARQAARVVPLITRSDATSVVAAQQSAAAAVAVAATGRPELGTAGAGEMATRMTALRQEIAELKALLPLERELEDASHESAQLETALARDRSEHAEIAARLVELRQELARTDESERAADVAAAGLAACAAEVQRQHDKHTAAVALPAAQGRLLTARETQVAREAAVNDARQDQLALLARRLDGMAGELARRLVDGRPCAVCGALEHPAPAVSSESVDPSDEDAAEATFATARDAADLGRQTVEQMTGEVAALASASRGLAVAESLALCHEAGERLRVLQETVLARDLASSSRAANAVASAALEQRLLALDAAIAEGHARIRSLAVVIDARTLAIRAAVGGFDSIAARLAVVEETARLVEIAAAAVDEAARAEVAFIADAQAAAAAADAAGFAGVAGALAAYRDDAECANAEAWCFDHDRALALVEAELADPALVIELEPAADVDAANRALEDAVATARMSLSRAEDLRRRSERLTTFDAHLAEVDLALTPARAVYDEIAGLADLTGGSNRLRMRLSAFVLAARLEQVAAAASMRLATMTAGRYTLVHSDEVGDARRKAGLGLKVCDSWTGTMRDAASLSGGETFMASLALALALADVVREEAGGTQIDCLFVDEGFGSLDDSTLDEVMDVLDELRDGGRLVGLVSHVAELRQRIPTQLCVLKGAGGSWLVLSGDLAVASAAMTSTG